MFDVERWMLNVQLFKLLAYFFGSANCLWSGPGDQEFRTKLNMTPVLLYGIIFLSSLVLTMVGLGGGLIFSPLFVLLEYPLTTAVSVSLFLNGIAALSASITYFRKKMVDVQTGLPLIVASTLSAPLGALLTTRISRLISKIIMS